MAAPGGVAAARSWWGLKSCAAHKKTLAPSCEMWLNIGVALLRRAAFLDVSSLNLAASQGAATFFARLRHATGYIDRHAYGDAAARSVWGTLTHPLPPLRIVIDQE